MNDLLERLENINILQDKKAAKMQPILQSEVIEPKLGETEKSYDASAIEVLEGLEPVRKRPGMYIGGTGIDALHHLVTEILDNAMDEAVAGFADKITIELLAPNKISISDNGRGIPIDEHPKFKGKSALEVILTTLHSGGKFSNQSYQTSGGLHGVGISVVNALSAELEAIVTRENKIWSQKYQRGLAVSPLTQISSDLGRAKKNSGTKIIFSPDEEIFQEISEFDPIRIFNLIKTKAYLFNKVTIFWQAYQEFPDVPKIAEIRFAAGIQDLLTEISANQELLIKSIFAGSEKLIMGSQKIEWCMNWCDKNEIEIRSFCNMISTPLGGTHELGMKNALLKAVQNFIALKGKKNLNLVSEDILSGANIIISIFIEQPEFQGQTKEKLVNKELIKQIEDILKDRFEHFLIQNIAEAESLIEFFYQKSVERLNRKKNTEVSRKTILNKLRLPGKLSDCSSNQKDKTEIFLVEGDSAGGSARQARDRSFQAVLPLKGKILNVASSSKDKMRDNQEISDLNIALGCGSGNHYIESKLRYDKVIIMTDADVDGAHIASLLMTYFFQEMPNLIRNGHLYLASPPLYRINVGGESFYANNDEQRDKIVSGFKKKSQKIEIGRFKGLGEMTPKQLKDTSMNVATRNLYKVILSDDNYQIASERIEHLMGKKPELRLRFIQEQSYFNSEKLAKELNI